MPSIGVGGLLFYNGDKFPAWRGNAIVGSMRFGEIPNTGHMQRIVFNERGEEIRREMFLTELRQRVREVREGPDGLHLHPDGRDRRWSVQAGTRLARRARSADMKGTKTCTDRERCCHSELISGPASRRRRLTTRRRSRGRFCSCWRTVRVRDRSIPSWSATAKGLAARGIDVVTFDFPYMHAKRGAPDKAPVLEQCFRTVIDVSRRTEGLRRHRLVIGGKSMGGRMATHLGAQELPD